MRWSDLMARARRTPPRLRTTDHRRCRAPRRREQGSRLVRAERPARGRAETRDRILEVAEDSAGRRACPPAPSASALLRARAGDRAQPRRHRRRPVLPLVHRGRRGRVLDVGTGARARRGDPGPRGGATYRGLAADKRVDGVILTDLRPVTSGSRSCGARPCRRDARVSRPAVAVPSGLGRRRCGHPRRRRSSRRLGHRRLAHVAGPSACCTPSIAATPSTTRRATPGIDVSIVVSRPTSAPREARAPRAAPRRADRSDRHRLLERSHGPRRLGVAQRAGLAVPERPLDHRLR